MIYGYVVLEEQPLYIRSHLPVLRTNLFASKAAIILASKQTYDEYLECLDKLALSPKREMGDQVALQTTVMNLNFSNLMNFVDQLSTSELTTLREHSEIHVNFMFSLAEKGLDARTEQAAAVEGILAWVELQFTIQVSTTYEIDAESAPDRELFIDKVCFELQGPHWLLVWRESIEAEDIYTTLWGWYTMHAYEEMSTASMSKTIRTRDEQVRRLCGGIQEWAQTSLISSK